MKLSELEKLVESINTKVVLLVGYDYDNQEYKIIAVDTNGKVKTTTS